MRQNFTFRSNWRMLRNVLVALCAGLSGIINGQTVVSTASGTNYLGNYSINSASPLTQSFVIQNSNATGIVLTDISMQMAPYFTATAGSPSVITLYYSATSLSGPVTTIGLPDWTQIATGNVTVPAALSTMPVLSGMSFVIPPATQYRFAIVASKGLAFSVSPVPTPNIFTAGGVSLKVGNNQVAGQNIGYAGVFPAFPAANTPAFFGGSISFITAVPCSGTPAPGNTISSGNSVCPAIGFNLSLQNPTVGTGVTYQWQSAAAIGGPWTNVGSNSPTYSTSLTATTFYQCLVTCGANTGTSAPVQVALTPPSGCYCLPPASDCTDDDVITRVLLSTLDNASTCSAGPPAGYANYTALPAPTVYSGASNPIRVEAPTNWTEQVAVWIDYNQNGQFETTEFTNLGIKPAGTDFVAGNIAIPSTALNGPTRMRVRIRFSTALTGTQACLGYTYGETEDYTVNITPCVPATIISAPSDASVACGDVASFTVNATGTLLSYSWQYRVDTTSSWQTLTASALAPAAASGLTTTTLSLSKISAALNGYQFRALVSGGCSAVDFSTPPATLTVTPVIPVVDPASASVCLGSVQQLSLTNLTLASTTVNFTSGPVSIAIPESPGGVSSGTSTINVAGIPAGAVITSMKVTLNMTHNWVGDVCYVMKAPNNKILNLDYFLGRTGNGGTNFANTVISSSGTDLLNTGTSPGFTGTFAADAGTGALIPAAPAGPVGYTPDVTTWSGLYSTPNGAYTLAFFDYFADPDPGTFTRWNLEITYEAPVLVQGVWTGPAGTMFSDAAATIAYTGTPATTIYVMPTVSSDYLVSFTTPTPCTSDTTTVPVAVATPITDVVDPVNMTACVGGSTTFTSSATGGPVTYQWQVSSDGGLTFNDISGATSATLSLSGITQSMNGYRYRAILTAGTCAGTITTTAAILTVSALPIVTLTSPDLLLTPGQTTSITASSNPAAAAGGWIWNYNGSTIAGNNTNTVSGIDIDHTGTYHATVTDPNGCMNTSAHIVIGSEASDHLWIYPNPNDGVFQVRYYYDPSSVAEVRGVYIYNEQGQLIEGRELGLLVSPPYLRMDFDLSRQSRGTYLVKVVHKHTGKIVSGLVVKQ